MRARPLLLLSLMLVAFVDPQASAATSPRGRERIEGAFIVALGRLPTASELQEWEPRQDRPAGELTRQLAASLGSDKVAMTAVAEASIRDAFGRPATRDDLEAALARPASYAELLARHLQGISRDPQEQAALLQRAYRELFRRDAYTEELEYWRKQGFPGYAVLIGCLEDWGRRNQPGLMVTAGQPAISVNCPRLLTRRVSPELEPEFRSALGLGPAEPGCSVLAVGAGRVRSRGGIAFLMAGRR